MINKTKMFFSLSCEWFKRKAGKPIVDHKKGCGYYFTIGLINYNPKKKYHEWNMQSGKIMIVKLLDYELFSDPHDMIKWSTWQYIGYKGEKPLSKFSFFEYLNQGMS